VTPVEAIEQAVRSAHPEVELTHIAPVDARTLELDGYVVAAIDEPVPHWLIVSKGFSELHEKETDDPERSGWGFELSCRAPREGQELDFGWVAHWMQHIADYLAESGAFVEAGHSKLMTEPESDDEICAVLFAEDPELEAITTQHGRVSFLQLVTINRRELDALERWQSDAFAALMRTRDPLLIAAPHRASLMDDDDFSARVAEGIERDGSSMGGKLGVDVMWFEQGGELQIHLSHDAIAWVEHGVRHRLPYGAPMALVGDMARSNTRVVLGPRRLLVRRWRVQDMHGYPTALVPLSKTAQAELLAALEGAPRTDRGAPYGFTLPSVKNLRFVLVDADTFHEPRYPF
jgi:hypothetical protein